MRMVLDDLRANFYKIIISKYQTRTERTISSVLVIKQETTIVANYKILSCCECVLYI